MDVTVAAVVAVFFFGMGVYALAAPAAMLRPFGITLHESQSRSEVRAVYGGFGLAIAGILVLTAIKPEFHRTGVMITVGVALSGMAFGRAISALIDGRTPFYPNWLYFAVEAVGAAALLTAA
ncbi:DUF4345 domain-containing protein [Mycobacterium sp.]|uniref:DUF4345 domain-containing protein n=1 Tax=Mycobacterium sp. TaxID=1785 RepID=UPI003BAA951F